MKVSLRSASALRFERTSPYFHTSSARRTCDELADMISRVIGHQQNGAQVRLRVFASWHPRRQIVDVTSELF